MRSWILALLAALVVHAAILLFGGIFFMKPDEPQSAVDEVDLLTDAADDKSEEPAEEPEPEQREEMRVETEAPPEMKEVFDAAPEPTEPTDLVARLDALSLSALESALGPGTGGDGFGAPAGSLASGGRIGGTGAAGALAGEEAEDFVFDIGTLDQKPRVLHQTAPAYPASLRQQKVEGTVYVVFVVDKDGRVIQPQIEDSPNEAFDAPTLEAVRRWRFEPAVVRGEKVRAKLRVPIRFSRS